MPPERIVRAYEAKIDDVLPGERSVVAKINTNDVDRYGTVIEPMGIDLRAYRENRVVLWEHGMSPDRGSKPIGQCRWVKPRRSEGDLIAKTKFHDDDFSMSLFEMYQDDTLNGFSVNVLESINPKRPNGPPSPEEIKDRPELANCWRIYRSTELCEYSGVGVPGNAKALKLAVSRGLWLPDDRLSDLGVTRDDGDDEEMMSEAGNVLPENHECFEKYCSCGKLVDRCRCAGGDKMERTEEKCCTECGGKMQPLRILLSAPVELPPLTGRTFEQEKRRLIESIRSASRAMPVSAITEHARAAMDLRRGIV